MLNLCCQDTYVKEFCKHLGPVQIRRYKYPLLLLHTVHSVILPLFTPPPPPPHLPYSSPPPPIFSASVFCISRFFCFPLPISFSALLHFPPYFPYPPPLTNLIIWPPPPPPPLVPSFTTPFRFYFPLQILSFQPLTIHPPPLMHTHHPAPFLTTHFLCCSEVILCFHWHAFVDVLSCNPTGVCEINYWTR